ncbi:UDP-N-acetylmuramate--L-alanine ligase [Candidatus Roizmanbacteria bacterium RIFCSPLOWO2_02_FULL_37_19]|uniref:UDP-N-acetylmuramate--L-alanine ligase n=1 Tax=Candidatus Roizmanbacteria bacterium RIFCSPHIGHO2_02_FULL_37_24 TaxID=1802037 RepID=A0A1F7GZ96_9BACT|nr:MAG: UDP-N-acetylmuramate--L-alanine ligase [Candidatus Roizmanbacteria bacterium RIFCSPHIGHO2_01_FULL_38_41]OGK24420.1 MAG: UDP-N-acetylmuramate--L-alanine ligase [Candidatus Roizmanbacteria bacterium RIFCSPHIGHO2_02_FULL_37_24]OGK32634.1 MAG: UDP-N-acetylmuramate--L-alanine ligase [Candidatus Roizmanbacteria bacterium RIFCSPHIGHO2_12_FULL_37_23]OGK44800.1 MAG: UDP-N-acetylmuramate--L-alanine ligase [Candidatus Roizmanbacteria bacterium RIFCSPLOWO2_01_FULL_37_57]OGK53948.1 MAG: UDP-N-acetyl
MQNIYLVGIKGVGMTALATYLKECGNNVWGSDIQDKFPTDEVLHEQHIKVLKGFSPKNITNNIDLVVTTGAHGGLTNIEVLTAQEKGVKVMTLAEEVGQLMDGYETKITICGSHGKTTTTSLISFILRQLRLSSSHLVGTSKFSGYYGGSFGGSDYLVVEGDEYVSSLGTDSTPRFMYQSPDYIICTNIDFDHPDVYKDINAVKKVFVDFFKKLKKNPKGRLIYCIDDVALRRLAEVLPEEKRMSYGFSEDADLVLHFMHTEEFQRAVFSARLHGEHLGVFKLPFLGHHNVQNAGSAIALSILLSLDLTKVKSAIALFKGLSRRLELIYKKNNIYLFDDYAHHPREIRALLEAVREKFPRSRRILVFQPHTYTRTKMLLNDFVHALGDADKSYVIDIFASAREKTDGKITSKDLEVKANQMHIKTISYVSDKKIMSELAKELKRGDVVITAGAGDVYKLHEGIISVMNKS